MLFDHPSDARNPTHRENPQEVNSLQICARIVLATRVAVGNPVFFSVMLR